ncbi:MAG: hypothetical protein NVS2B14_21670 [Chamaesiphon sp.]
MNEMEISDRGKIAVVQLREIGNGYEVLVLREEDQRLLEHKIYPTIEKAKSGFQMAILYWDDSDD